MVKEDAYKDLALIKVDTVKSPYLILGRSSDVKVLDSIIAVGFPYADKIGVELSAYDGTVNAIRESGRIPLLQIDANVNPGNSGGPVLNDRGEVIGVVVGKVDAVDSLLNDGNLPERINFAIPIDEVKGVISAAYPFGYPPPSARDKLEPSAIFATAKPAVAFVMVELAGVQENKNSMTRVPAASSNEDNLSREDAIRFVEQFVNGHDSDRPLDMGRFYVPRPIYMNYGEVDVAFIRKDALEYRQKWPLRRYRLVSSPEIMRHKDRDVLVVRYRMAFDVENSAKQISGEAEYFVAILDSSRAPRIFAVKESILWRKVRRK